MMVVGYPIEYLDPLFFRLTIRVNAWSWRTKSYIWCCHDLSDDHSFASCNDVGSFDMWGTNLEIAWLWFCIHQSVIGTFDSGFKLRHGPQNGRIKESRPTKVWKPEPQNENYFWIHPHFTLFRYVCTCFVLSPWYPVCSGIIYLLDILSQMRTAMQKHRGRCSLDARSHLARPHV